MKKIASIVVALMLVLTLAVGVVATGEATIKVSDETAKAGEDVVLKVEIENNPAFNTGNISIEFDENALELPEGYGIQIGETDLLSDLMSSVANTGKVVAFTGVNDVEDDGVVFTIKLKVKADAPEGKYIVSVNVKYLDNNDEKDIQENITVVQGSVTIPHVCTDFYDIEKDPASCQYTGVKAHQECKVCGKVYIDGVEVSPEDLIIPKKDHIPHAWDHDDEEHWAYCICDEEVLREPHADSEWLFNDESHWKFCDVCIYDYEMDEHTYGDWVVVDEPEVGKEGTKERECICGHKETGKIDPLPDVPVPPTGEYVIFAVVAMLAAGAAVVIISTKRKNA